MQPWLVFDGVEIGNGARVLSYLRRGLGGAGWIVEASGGDLNDVSQLACYCDEENDGPYIDPATDLAPWWDPSKPESDSFLGFYPTTVDLVPAMGRTVAAAGMLGTTLGRIVLGGALVQVKGWVISATPAGQAYGERWLIAALRGSCGPSGCDTGTLCVLPSCPEGVGYSASSFRTLERVGLIDYTPARSLAPDADWYVREVAFQMRSELPWMFEDPIPVAVPTRARRNIVSGTAVTGEWPGDAGVRIALQAGGSDAGPIRVTGTPRRSFDDACTGPGGQSGAVMAWNIDQNWRYPGEIFDEISRCLNEDCTAISGIAPIHVTVAQDYDTLRASYIADVSGHHWYGTPTDQTQIPWPNNPDTGPYLWIPDGAGGLTTPDAANLDILGDLALEVVIEVENLGGGSAFTGVYDLVSKWGAAGQRSYLLTWNVASRQLEFAHSSDGTATVSTATAPFDPYGQGALSQPFGGESAARLLRPKLWIRADLDVDNGAAGHTKRIQFSTDGVTYTTIATVVTGGTTAVFNSTALTTFCNRTAGGYFMGGFYSGRIGVGLWPSPSGIRADPNIATDASATAGTFSDGTQTWTIVRPASGLKAAIVNRGMFITGDASHQRGVALEPSANLTPLVGSGAYPGQFRADESFTVIWYGKVWGTSTGQTLLSRRLVAGGAGWEIRRGSTANTPQAVISDGSTTVTVNPGVAITPGAAVSIALVRDVVADTFQLVINGVAAGAPTADTTTLTLTTEARLIAGGASTDAVTRGIGLNSDQEFYAAAVIHGRVLTAAQIAAQVAEWATTGAAGGGPAIPAPCFDMLVNVEAGTELVIDGATHRVEKRRSSDGVLVGGLDSVEFTGPFTWPEMGPCSEICWAVDAADVGTFNAGGVLVTIEQINREV